jgi:hypothetical protein
VNDNGVLSDSYFNAGALIGLCEEGHVLETLLLAQKVICEYALSLHALIIWTDEIPYRFELCMCTVQESYCNEKLSFVGEFVYVYL